MSEISQRRVRTSLLYLATSTALAALCAAPAFAGNVNLSGLQTAEKFDRFIVQYRDGSQERTDATALQSSLGRAARAVPAAKGKALGLKKLRRLGIPMELIQADRALDRAEAETLMRQIAADPNVLHVEPDVMMQAFVTPNDSRYTEQWHYYPSGGGLNLPSAWDRSTGSGVVVAVVDSGILSHADLNANILPGYDFVSSTSAGDGGSGDGNGRDSNPLDSSNVVHGTHVAGTIAAVTNNASGVAGVAYNAKIVPIRALGNGGYGNTSDIVDAIVWASGGAVNGVPANANPAEVINLSLGGASTCTASSAYQTAVNSAVSRGSTVVVAAGNSNQDVAGFSPAGCNNVIAVAASDKAGNRSWYSNYGAKIDVTAPGGETWHCSKMPGEFWPLAFTVSTSAQCGTAISHDSDGILSTIQGGGYDFYDGTSMATPHVAGIVALMQAAASTPLTPAQVEATLKSNSAPISSAKCPGGCGAGFINADAAVAAAAGGGGGTPTPTTQTYTNGTDVSIPDNNTTGVTSSISVSGRTGNAPNPTSVAVNIVHTYQGDLIVDLLAPDGSIYTLHNRTGSGTDNIVKTYSVNLSSEALNGNWRLRVRDLARQDVGYINSWSITF